MVTHDRYFLDAVCNHIYELARNKVKLYVGNYSTYLEKKQTEAEIEANTERRIESVLRFERDWLMRGPCARGTKAKARIQRDEALINREKFQADREFTFEVKENIAEDTDLRLSTAVVTDIDKQSLKTEDGSLIKTGRTLVNGEQPITSKYIKDLEAKGILDGIEKISIQDNQNTKQTTINSLYNYIIQQFEETIDREIKSVIGTSATELNSLKTKLNNDIAQATNDLIAIEYLKRQYQEKL